MAGYQAAWQARDPAMFAALFHEDGRYHNTPFQVQTGRAQLAEYWRRVQLQEDVRVTYEVLADHGDTGIAHWHVTYQVASEELFQIWARSTGTGCRPASRAILCRAWCSMGCCRHALHRGCAPRRASGGTACRRPEGSRPSSVPWQTSRVHTAA